MNKLVDQPAVIATPLSEAIRRANAAGRMGLVVFVVPGFPTVERYRSIVEYLEDTEAVTVIENTVPVARGHETASPVILRAHLTALQHSPSLDFNALLGGRKPRFVVLYRSILSPDCDVNKFLEQYKGGFCGLAREFDSADHSYYADICRKHGVECVQPIAPSNGDERNERALEFASPGGMVYLSCSAMTAGKLASPKEIRDCASKAKRRRPDITIVAGMGVKTPEDVRGLSAIQELDGVVLGSAFLDKLEKSNSDAERFLSEIEGALARPGGRAL